MIYINYFIRISVFLISVHMVAAQSVVGVKKREIKDWMDKAYQTRYSNLDSSFYYGYKVLEVAQRQRLLDVESDALRSLSTTYQAKGDYQKALDYGDKALEIAERLKDRLKIAHCHNILGMIYDQKGDFTKALQQYEQSYSIYKSLNNKEWLAMVANNLGILFKAQGDYEKVIPYYREAYGIYKELNLPVEVAFCEVNLGSVFYYTQQYDSCIYYSIQAERELLKHDYKQIVPSAQGNTGLGYLGLRKWREAKHYLELSLAGHRKYDNKKEIAFVLVKLADIYERLQMGPQQLLALEEARDIAYRIGAHKENMEAYQGLVFYYEAQDSYKEALEAYKNYDRLKDTLFDEEKMKAITNYQFKYETERKEQQIELLNREAAIQKLKLYQRTVILISVSVILLIVALVVYLWQNRRKIRAEAKLQRDAAKQILLAEERERRRIATDLHDGVGQMLSAALLNLTQSLEDTAEGTSVRVSTEKAFALLRESYDEMRSISHQMMPNVLLKVGLASSVREFVEKIDGPKIKVRLDIIGLDHRLDEQIETVLYRSIQEVVNNVIKHAGASLLVINLMKDEEGVTATIEDNGRGFDTSKMASFEGIGLRNVSSRIALVNGTLDIDSTIGKGTLFVIYIPNP